MAEESILQKSKALKVCYWMTNIVYYFSWIAMFLLLALVLFNIFADSGIKYMQLPVTVTYSDYQDVLPLGQVASDDMMVVAGFHRVTLDVTNYKYVTYNMVMPFILLVGLIYILYLFRIFLRTVRKNSPFDPANPSRLKIIGYLVTISGPVAGLMNYIYASIYMHYIKLPGASVEVDADFYPVTILVGLMIVVIAHIFEIAVQMKIEQDMTI